MLKRFTDDNVEALTPPRGKQQVFAWDRDCKGLGIRITSKNRRSWVFRYSMAGRDRRLTIAAYHELDLQDARKRAVELRGKVDRGEDPSATIAAVTGDPTLTDLWAKLERDYLPRRSSGHQKNLTDAWVRLILPRLGGATPLTELTWEAVDEWHQAMKSTPTQANRALAALKVGLNMARKWQLVERGTFNVATDHEPHPEGAPKPGKPKARPFTAAEAKAIGKALKKEPDPVQQVALTIFLLTGLRPGEVCKLKWEDIGDGGVTYIGEAKKGPRYALLSTRAEELIRTLPEAGEWVFPSPRNQGEPLGGLESDDHGLGEAWKRVRAAAPMTLPPVYSGRHNWISTAAAEGIGDDVRRLLAGHVSSGNGAHGSYLHVTEALRPISDKVAEKVAEGLGLN